MKQDWGNTDRERAKDLREKQVWGMKERVREKNKRGDKRQMRGTRKRDETDGG